MNRVKVGLCLLILVLVWGGNLAYFVRHQLDQPLFLKHYYNIQNIGDQVSFELFYLVNQKDEVGVSAIHIPTYGIYSYPNWENERNRTPHHKVKSVQWEWGPETLAALEDNAIIREIEGEFTNGSRQRVNIDEIRIRRVKADHPYIHSQSSGGSSDHTGFTIFREGEPLKFIGLKHLPPNLNPEVLSIKVNGQSIDRGIEPERFDFKPFVELKYAFQFPKDDPRAQHVYGGTPILEVQTEDGEVKEGLMFIHYTPNFSREDIQAMLRERRAN